jgi:hypothetical protein
MKKINIFILLICCLLLVGCTNNGGENNNKDPNIVDPGTTDPGTTDPGITDPNDEKATFVNVYPIEYNEVIEETDMDKFYAETTLENGRSHDAPHEYGFVKSVWHNMKINGKDVPVYSARSGYGIHSFAWVDIETDGKFELDINLTLSVTNYTKVDVLPEKEGVIASIDGRNVTAKIENFGSFSFVFNEEAYMAVTLYVAPFSKLEVPEGYTVKEIEPGRYENIENNTLDFVSLGETNVVYHFKTGVYDITSIHLPSNTIAYFDRGVYMRVFEETKAEDPHYRDYKAGLESSGNNIKVLGRALFDFSKCMGGDNKTKGVYNFTGSNLHVEGIITINANNWSMCFWGSKNVLATRNMFFSYRTYSDGIMFSDCEDSQATHNFVRTGDDALEVKSFTSGPYKTNNVLFENNAVWTDKGIAYGAIFESLHDVENVYFRNNSVGFAQASWSNHLGICTVQMGSVKNSTWHNIYFENIEVFKTSCAAVSVYNRATNENEGGKIRDIYFKNITVKHIKEINLPVFAINIVIRLDEGLDFRNSSIGSLYIDNLSYSGVNITPENYLEYSNIDISEYGRFSNSNIKINTLNAN